MSLYSVRDRLFGGQIDRYEKEIMAFRGELRLIDDYLESLGIKDVDEGFVRIGPKQAQFIYPDAGKTKYKEVPYAEGHKVQDSIRRRRKVMKALKKAIRNYGVLRKLSGVASKIEQRTVTDEEKKASDKEAFELISGIIAKSCDAEYRDGKITFEEWLSKR